LGTIKKEGDEEGVEGEGKLGLKSEDLDF